LRSGCIRSDGNSNQDEAYEKSFEDLSQAISVAIQRVLDIDNAACSLPSSLGLPREFSVRFAVTISGKGRESYGQRQHDWQADQEQ
jgi:hypothetical protein